MVYKMRNKEVIMSITEKMMEAIEEVLDEKEREMILICLDYEAGTGGDPNSNWTPDLINGWPCYHTTKLIFKKYHKRTTGHHIRTKVKSAMEKLEKSPKLRAVSAFSS